MLGEQIFGGMRHERFHAIQNIVVVLVNSEMWQVQTHCEVDDGFVWDVIRWIDAIFDAVLLRVILDESTVFF